MEEIYYENTTISYKTVNIFETMFTEKKHEIIKEILKNIKEKYNIDIITNGNESRTSTTDTRICSRPPSTSGLAARTTAYPIRTNPPPDT